MDAEFRTSFASQKRRSDSLDRIKLAARVLFLDRGYHATKPQDIAREAGLGHSTFYLHYADKRACFFAFVEDARNELAAHIRTRTGGCTSLEQAVSATLEAICEYTTANPGMTHAAMIDESLIGTSCLPGGSLVHQWGQAFARFIREGVRDGTMAAVGAPDLIGQAIAGATYQCWQETERNVLPPNEIAASLTRFVSRALAPETSCPVQEVLPMVAGEDLANCP